MPQRLQSHKRQQGHKRLQDHKRSTIQPHNRLGFQEPKRNKLKDLNSPNLRGELKPMHQMQEASPSLSNSTKATKAIGGIREEEHKRRTQNSPRSRSQGFLHKEGIWLGGTCRSRSPLSNPSKRCKNHRRGKGRGQALQGQQWRRERVKNCPKELTPRRG